MTHRSALVAYASAIAGSHAQAEDVVQEAWFRLKRANDFDLVQEPVAYLYRLVRNLAIDTRRTLTRETARTASESDADVLTDDQPSPEQAILARDELRVVLEALAELPERTRIAVRMNRMEGRKLQEVANHLGLSVTRTHALIAEGIAHCDRLRGKMRLAVTSTSHER
ncbi:sigma-70 family RNA polymerase sigma factor [Reyranella sp.]|uniref:sigma-70 family RNA polymerase sigma factor n=1 Tax=Reyranella sp. TaxID=1929291 RepID=UPI0011FF48FD|nr:sigma-70 family RNA polymerase sigma factor [Reyranella sp.]TAJ83422.1 MAG: sigma-70 family RNA polymerase sigma factor [Reyranella sp.]